MLDRQIMSICIALPDTLKHYSHSSHKELSKLSAKPDGRESKDYCLELLSPAIERSYISI